MAVAADVVCPLDGKCTFDVDVGSFLTAAIPVAAFEVEKDCAIGCDCRMARTANLAGCVRNILRRIERRLRENWRLGQFFQMQLVEAQLSLSGVTERQQGK